MIAPAAAFRMCFLALGLVAGLMSQESWLPAPQFRHTARWLPAASQHLVAAETRAAAPVLSPETSEDDAPLVDGWLARISPHHYQGALGQILDHPAPMLRHRWLAVLFPKWWKSSKKDALDYAMGINSASLRRSAMKSVISEWARTDHQGAWHYVEQIGDPMLKTSLEEHLIADAGLRSHSLAANLALSLADPFTKRKAVAQVATTWSQADIIRSQVWAESLADESLRRAAMGPVIVHLARGSQPHRALDEAMKADASWSRDLLALAIQTTGYQNLKTPLIWLRNRRATAHPSMQLALRELGELIANDPSQTGRIAATAHEFAHQAPLRDAFLSGAAMSLIARGHFDQATHLRSLMGPGIEYEDVSKALSR